jgi:hypothetical protein
MAIKKVVIFNTTPLTKRDFIRFGGKVFKENGFDVWFYDFSPVVYPKLYENCTFHDLYSPENHILLSSVSEIFKKISELSSDSFVIMFSQFELDTFLIFKALSKTKIPYCVVANHSIPIGEAQDSSFFLKVKNKLHLLNINSIKKCLYRPRFAHLLGIRHPEFCIVSSELSLKRHKARYLVRDDTEILWAHALDYDVYLENKGVSVEDPAKNATFLDPIEPMFQGDCPALGAKMNTTVEKYYPSICKFFDYVEKELDISVEIAAHPKTNHPPYPEYFGGRKTLIDNTFGMIKNSQLVMNHSSTSIQFAILLKKPILLLTTDEIEKNMTLSVDIKAYARSLKKNIINIDKPLAVDWEKELHVDEKIYNDYIELYIKKGGSEELNIWQILANRLKDI